MGMDGLAHVGLQSLRADLLFPAADDDGGDAVADQVGEGATFTHEPVYADEQRERRRRLPLPNASAPTGLNK